MYYVTLYYINVYTISYHIILHYIALYYIILYNIIIILYYIISYYILLYSIILYSTIFYYIASIQLHIDFLSNQLSRPPRTIAGRPKTVNIHNWSPGMCVRPRPSTFVLCPSSFLLSFRPSSFVVVVVVVVVVFFCVCCCFCCFCCFCCYFVLFLVKFCKQLEPVLWTVRRWLVSVVSWYRTEIKFGKQGFSISFRCSEFCSNFGVVCRIWKDNQCPDM